jgi:serine/threonine protein kinase
MLAEDASFFTSTRIFAAPELKAKGRQNVDLTVCDLYSLAVTLYEMLTGNFRVDQNGLGRLENSRDPAIRAVAAVLRAPVDQRRAAYEGMWRQRVTI